jgi:hypothetical protein
MKANHWHNVSLKIKMKIMHDISCLKKRKKKVVNSQIILQLKVLSDMTQKNSQS